MVWAWDEGKLNGGVDGEGDRCACTGWGVAIRISFDKARVDKEFDFEHCFAHFYKHPFTM